ncbi:MAG: hypothetical protein IPM36_04515 [Lewinellaceae bacterium]|nr:hypothetical protein [Lewinellaceae bacterium]
MMPITSKKNGTVQQQVLIPGQPMLGHRFFGFIEKLWNPLLQTEKWQKGKSGQSSR